MENFIQEIPNMKPPMDDVAQRVHLDGLNLMPINKEIVLTCSVLYSKNETDVTKEFNKAPKVITINNNMTVYQRKLADFSLISNPNYVDQETTPDELIYLEAPGYDYISGLMLAHPELIWIILEKYILENYNDGYFDNI